MPVCKHVTDWSVCLDLFCVCNSTLFSANIIHVGNTVYNNNMAEPVKKKSRTFKTEWFQSFKWLSFIDEAMVCEVCTSAKLKNAFVSGCKDFQRSSLLRHQETAGHVNAASAKSGASQLLKCFKTANDQAQDGLTQQLRTVTFMVSENMALSKFSGLIRLQQENGAQITNVYRHHEQVEEMLQCLSKTVETQLDHYLRKANFVSLATDESVDIAVYKKLIILVSVVVEGEVKVFFGENRDVPDGKADTIVQALKSFIQTHNIPDSKVAGLGSDGAAVMTGRHNGVGVQLARQYGLLIHVHCCAHRLALAVAQSAKEVVPINKFEQTVNHIYKYYTNSPVRYNRLRELEEVMINATVTLKEPSSVRWLSLHEAITAIGKCWPALVASLSADAANDNPIARGLSQKVDCLPFVAYTCLLEDILPLFTRLSKSFQDSDLDFDKMESMLTVTRQALEAYTTDQTLLPKFDELMSLLPDNDGVITWMGMPLKRTYLTQIENSKNLLINELLSNLDRRFPENGMMLLRALNTILNPKKVAAISQVEVAQHGLRELQQICNHMQTGGVAAGVFVEDRAKRDFFLFKLHCRNAPQQSLKEFARSLMTTYKDDFPDFAVLMEFLLVVPLNSATCERGFSQQNLVKTKSRNRLVEERMNQLLRITINGPDFAAFDYADAAANFRAMRNRNK